MRYVIKSNDGIDDRFVRSLDCCTYSRAEAWEFTDRETAVNAAWRFRDEHSAPGFPLAVWVEELS
jgi:hypothetical protein